MGKYKVVDKKNHYAVYAVGCNKQRLQERIDNGYFHKYLIDELKNVELIIIESI